MTILILGSLALVIALVSCSIPKGEKVDFYDQSSFEVR